MMQQQLYVIAVPLQFQLFFNRQWRRNDAANLEAMSVVNSTPVAANLFCLRRNQQLAGTLLEQNSSCSSQLGASDASTHQRPNIWTLAARPPGGRGLLCRCLH